MKKTHLSALVALAAVASHATFATGAPDNHPSPNASMTINANGAFVSPYFVHEPGVATVVKTGPAASTSCKAPVDYTLVAVTYRDRAGSFGIKRPANVTGDVRYCVTRVNVDTMKFNVIYDRVG
jgi:hypothetical protein